MFDIDPEFSTKMPLAYSMAPSVPAGMPGTCAAEITAACEAVNAWNCTVLNAAQSSAPSEAMAAVDAVHVSPAVQGYILALVRGTRVLAEAGTSAKRYLNFGASPRASLALYQAGRALAWLRGEDYVSPALVQELAPEVMRHRIGLTYEAEAEEISPDKIIAQVVTQTPVPAK